METYLVIIGGSSSLGRDVAEGMCGTYNVLTTFNKSVIKETDRQIKPYKLDLENSRDVKNFCSKLKHLRGRIAIIFLATLSQDSLFVRTEISDWARGMQVNLISCSEIAKSVLPRMIDDRWGRLIFVGSVAADRGEIGTSIYSSTKHSLFGLSKVISREYGRFGVTSNILRLGYFDKGLITGFTEEQQKSIKDKIPKKRFGTKEDLCRALEFMLGCDYLNGTILTLDGGYS